MRAPAIFKAARASDLPPEKKYETERPALGVGVVRRATPAVVAPVAATSATTRREVATSGDNAAERSAPMVSRLARVDERAAFLQDHRSR
jgi:hypothetical protein